MTKGPGLKDISKGRSRSLSLSAGTLLLGVLMLEGGSGPRQQASVAALPVSGTATRCMPTAFDERLWASMGHESWYAEHGYLSALPAASEESSWRMPQLFLPVVAREPPPTPTTRPTFPPTLTPAPTPSATPWQPPNGVEARAVWLSRFDWTCLMPNCPGGQLPGPSTIRQMVANIDSGGFNMILFQVRGTGDAFYTPGLEPWSARLTGSVTATLGLDPGWDPLAVMISEAHARGIQVHAYLNVYPIWLGTSPPPDHTTPPHFFWVWSRAAGSGWSYWRQWDKGHQPMLLNDNYLWASPGNASLVEDHIVAVAADILRRYPVDGMHLDMLRYANADYSCDPASEARWGAPCFTNGDYRAWQRSQVTHLVSRIYSEGVLPLGRHALLSAAVWWYPQDLWGIGCSGGYDNYYQDSQGWLSLGAIDAEMPMLYGCPAFADGASGDGKWTTVMQDWLSHRAGRFVFPGIHADLSFASIVARIGAERAYAASVGAVPGHAVYSYSVVNSHGYWGAFASGPYQQRAAAPMLSWHP